MAVDQALQDAVVATCRSLQPPVLPQKASDAAEHVVQAFLLLPTGVEVDSDIEAEMSRLGVAGAVVPGSRGQSRLHEAAAASGLDTSQPLVWVEEATYDLVTQVVRELDLGVAQTLALSDVDWADVGRPKLFSPPNAPGATLRVRVLLDGSAELQVLEDNVPLIVVGANVVGTGTPCEATIPGERPRGVHVYWVQARGTGTIDAGSLVVAVDELVARVATGKE
jgi:hypothetical protein